MFFQSIIFSLTSSHILVYGYPLCLVISIGRGRLGKIVKTSFGAVDGRALEKLQESFDTMGLLRGVDAIDQVRYRDEELRQDMLKLHGMAHNLINHDYGSGMRGDESIGELAWRLTGEIRDCIAYLEQAYKAVKPLESLLIDPDDEWEEEQTQRSEKGKSP